MSMLGLSNFLLFQWLFLRLAFVYNSEGVYKGWKILTGIVPLTGWWSPYRYFPPK